MCSTRVSLLLSFCLLWVIFELNPVHAQNASNIAAAWANEGGDKVTRDELRASMDSGSVLNTVWDGSCVKLFGARNEIVSFNLVLEAPTSSATNVNVSLTSLNGPDAATITTTPASGNDVFNYIGRNIELFYVRYLEIKGLSTDLFYAGYDYDERHIPERCRRPHDTDGEGFGGWTDRPCHNKFYPDIAVPLELHSPFTIMAGTNQSIWGDIYIPKTVLAGNYTGTIEVTEDGTPAWQIPIRLLVRDFTLPDLPSARTMLYLSSENINDRYLGEDNAYPEPGTAVYTQSLELADRHFQLTHRHKISLIDEYIETEQMDKSWTSRLNGELFTAARGYDGVGVGAGNNVYSIGTYGNWPWQDGTQADMWANTDVWVNWFDGQAFATPTEYFLYLIDESEDYPQTEQWAQWINNNPGPGQRLMSMATIPLPSAAANTPSLDIPTSWVNIGITEEWQNAADSYVADPDKQFYMYNSRRPLSGSFALEDDGVALRVLAWAQHKKGIDRWFYWESTYYNNNQGNTAHTNVFQQAHTFGNLDGFDNVLGETGWNYLNGDGVLLYPGTDTRYPADSYGVQGPLASLRLKHWRRGIQDVDYLMLAAAIDPARTAQIVDRIVPKVLWEVGVSDPSDPTWVRTNISWSTDPNDWEEARAELADIIESATTGVASSGDFDGDGKVWTGDFTLFVAKFGLAQGDPGFDPAFDLDEDGRVWTGDFSIFVGLFGTQYGTAKPVVASLEDAGKNKTARISLKIAHMDPATTGAAQAKLIVVDICLKSAAELRGYGMRVDYDPEALEFLGATADNGQGNLLNSRGGTTPLFLVISGRNKPGEIWIANALAGSEAVSGSGLLAELRFQIMGQPASPVLPVSISTVELFDKEAYKTILTTDHLADVSCRLLLDTCWLAQNWPNPFNATTSICYRLPEKAFVSLRIYNILGQSVRKLVEKKHAAGYYTVQWDGKDNFGTEVASGIYLYRLTAGDWSKTKRMLLLR